MDATRCPNCASPMEVGSLANAFKSKCAKCGYEGTPMKAPDSLYEKMKSQNEDPLDDFFRTHMGLESIFSKLAIVSLFGFIISLASLELKHLTFVTFAGFLLFSIFYGFVRFKNSDNL